MDLIKKYSQLTRNQMNNPQKAFKWIKMGAGLQYFRWKNFPDKSIPPSMRYLNEVMFKYFYEPFKYPEKAAYVNLFAPTEILHAFDIYPMFVESVATFLSGLYLEDYLIEAAENKGFSETLCSYHKTFLGAIESEIMPIPQFSLASSIICDANTKTFSHVNDKLGIPGYIIDIPSVKDKNSLKYVRGQLEEMITMVERVTGKKFEIDKLRKIIEIENNTKSYMKKQLEISAKKSFVNHVTLEMSKLMLTHSAMGRRETLEFYKRLVKDMETYIQKDRLRIFWIHVMPYFDRTLRDYFNYNDKYYLIGMELNFHDLKPLDTRDPLSSLAEKMIDNIYNGDYSKRVDRNMEFIDILKPDGIINFMQWGCKQTIGGAQLVKDRISKTGIPYLALDGDGGDRRNNPKGQIKTRFEAFMEIVEKRKENKI